jgi:hypothetical protein
VRLFSRRLGDEHTNTPSVYDPPRFAPCDCQPNNEKTPFRAAFWRHAEGAFSLLVAYRRVTKSSSRRRTLSATPGADELNRELPSRPRFAAFWKPQNSSLFDRSSIMKIDGQFGGTGGKSRTVLNKIWSTG